MHPTLSQSGQLYAAHQNRIRRKERVKETLRVLENSLRLEIRDFRFRRRSLGRELRRLKWQLRLNRLRQFFAR